MLRNYENALAKHGGTVVFADKTRETLQLVKDGREIWVEVTAEFTGKYGLTIVEREAMKQEIVANAETFSNDLRSTGHVAVYGIFLIPIRRISNLNRPRLSRKSPSCCRRTQV